MNVYTIEEDGSKTEFCKSCITYPSSFSTYDEGESLFVQKRKVGVITKFINKSQLLVRMENGEDDLDDPYASENKETTFENKIFYFEPAVRTHKAFAGADLAF
jgi:SET domain-containing protein